MSFKTVDPEKLPKHFESQTVYKHWSDFWMANNIYKYNPDVPKEDTFVIDTPPPTVSGSLHLGHAFSYSHTDFIARYQRMKGKNIFYPMGWDDNGLPTERRVQNHYNVRCDSKAEFIPEFLETFKPEKEGNPQIVSRQNFIELCGLLTKEDEIKYKNLWQKLGLSVDWQEEYATIDVNARRAAQYSFIDLYEKGHLYTSSAPIMWDVDFQTSIAQAEIEDRPVQGEMFKLLFFLDNLEDSFEIATTRPELIPACVGIVTNPDDERYKHLIGKYAVTPLFGVRVPIFSSSLVDKEKGSGVVMVCTFGDATDMQWWRENNLELRQVIGLNGRLQPVHFGDEGWESCDADAANHYYQMLAGKTVFTAKKTIVELLRTEKPGWQKKISLTESGQKTERMVKFFEKGDKPLEFIPSRQWFVRLLDKKEKLIELGQQITWEPAFAQTRYQDWTNNLAFDWNISRQRYFGVPIPVWYPIDAEGKINYLKPILPTPDLLPVDPTIHVPKGYSKADRDQPNGFTGETDVFDTWFTSSLTPQISSHWIDDPARHNKLFPADVRPQSHEIIRTWAFYTIVKAYLHNNTIPWSRVLISGWILDPDRKKMSKSKGNVQTPEDWIDKFTPDGVRYWSAKARIGVDTVFDESVMKNGMRLVTKLFNAGKFVLSQKGSRGAVTNELDKAFIEELRKLITTTSKYFEDYDHSAVLVETETFFWNKFTDSYIELVKKRASADETDEGERNSAITTLRIGLDVLLRSFAPFLPYITEELWSWSLADEKGQKSIHIANWPVVEELNSITKPVSKESFSVALKIMDDIKRHKTNSSLSYSDSISSVVFKANNSNAAIVNTIKSDIVNYAKIKSPSIELDDTLSEINLAFPAQ